MALRDREDIERLIARVAQGDRAAFSELYDATHAKLYGLCLRILRQRSEAEDALQDAYVRIWANSERFRPGGHSPMTWLITITRNLCIDRLRARGSRAEDGGPMPEFIDPAPDPEAAAIQSDIRRRIEACLQELQQDRAQAVRAAYLDGSTYKDLAAQFDVPLNTMRTWLRRALIALRGCLDR